jgi:hypothetical protein
VPLLADQRNPKMLLLHFGNRQFWKRALWFSAPITCPCWVRYHYTVPDICGTTTAPSFPCWSEACGIGEWRYRREFSLGKR